MCPKRHIDGIFVAGLIRKAPCPTSCVWVWQKWGSNPRIVSLMCLLVAACAGREPNSVSESMMDLTEILAGLGRKYSGKVWF
jgi:hypothetical protein